MVTFVGELVMLISTFKVISNFNSGVRSTEKRNPSYFLRNKRSQGESVTALRKVPRKQPTACQHPVLKRDDRLGKEPLAGFGTVVEDITGSGYTKNQPILLVFF